jgi:CBS domain-containing protein
MQAKRFGVYTCSPDSTLLAAANRMADEDVSALVVVDNDGYLAGIITRSDLIRATAGGIAWDATAVRDYMTGDVVTVGLHTTMGEVARMLSEKHIHRVVAVRPEGERVRPVAVVSAADVLYHFVRAARHTRSTRA